MSHTCFNFDDPDDPEKKRRLDKISVALSRVARHLDRLDVDIDAVLQDVKQLADASQNSGQTRGAETLKAGFTRGNSDLDDQKCGAMLGVIKLSLATQSNGRANLVLENRQTIPLGPRLAALVAILIEDDGSSQDHLVPWKKVAYVVDRLQKMTDRTFSKRAFNQLILLLRDALQSQNENRWFVMRDPKLGLRFALRRKTEIVTGANHN